MEQQRLRQQFQLLWLRHLPHLLLNQWHQQARQPEQLLPLEQAQLLLLGMP
jgi:hypothetical protein